VIFATFNDFQVEYIWNSLLDSFLINPWILKFTTRLVPRQSATSYLYSNLLRPLDSD
jgi:hypothetical protein